MKIQEATKRDATALLDLFSSLDNETKHMLFESGERRTTIAQQEAILEGFSDDRRGAFLVAKSGSIDGFCVMIPGKQLRNQHVASLVIGVRKSSWSRSVGSRLMKHALERAIEAGITRVELTVRTDNVRAIALYKKFGFVQEGERIGSLFIDNELKSEFYMARVTQ